LRKNYLLTPGPTSVPASVLLSAAHPIIHHRTPQFQSILKEVNQGLKAVFQTGNDVFIFSSSGTGAMEAAVVNLLSPGDKALVIQAGKFGERFTEICTAYGINAITLDVPWGRAVDPELVRQKLKEDNLIKAVFATHCETSTGVVTDIKSLGNITRDYDAVLVADAISALGSLNLPQDEWGVDVVVAGSQKGLMLPPGLSFISVSAKAWGLIEKSRCPKYYFDLKKAKKAWAETDTPFTPAISIIISLRESLRLIREEGLENVFNRHKRLARVTRAAMSALGLELFAPEAASDAVTAVKVPDGIDGKKLVKELRDEWGITLAGGQSELTGKIFRIAHMGYTTEFDILMGISAIEMWLFKAGYKLDLGAGVRAAEKELLEG
jgi:aspartate aminotransferase-like enzyme